MQEYNCFIIQIIFSSYIEIQRMFLYMSVELMEHDEVYGRDLSVLEA